MPLHPQAEAFLSMVADAPPLDTCTVEENRAQLLGVIPLTGDRSELAEVRDTTLPGPGGDVPVRLYRPSADGDLPVLAYFHGGGWVLCDLDTHDTTCRDLARYSGAAVVAVDYRRAPEAPFPAAFEDCLAVTRALLDGSAGLGTDPDRVAVGGDSAGGNLAAGVAQALRGHTPSLVHQVLVYPLTDADGVGRTASYAAYGEGHFLTERDIGYFLQAYAGDTDRADPRLSPARAADLSGLPPATVVTAECDPLCDEGAAYAAALTAAGVPAQYTCFAGQVHPFVLLGGLVDAAHDARRLIGARLAEAFAAAATPPVGGAA
ncbi:alpha/beta hydrolase [Geodermatophilus sp. DSM 44513]|uniref:alpha/beta hydrolase n=1 Tax=Geodermatophilus sp. DSM 44513 TaxID=1528104 RepID=UPI00128AC90E|nr:alpha/beta hydrolase [Geodermatophilus sp. DSM 44513]WNV76994.1 alpha/beta hydrolase [Geodermatophilus sp. DSM 44513]